MRSVHHDRGPWAFLPIALVLTALLGLSACGSQGAAIEQAGATERPIVVVTTSILGDVVENVSGGQFDVVTIMPAGADPHLFQPSAQDVAAMERASAVIGNGALFEEGLLDALRSTETSGVPVMEAIAAVTPLNPSGSDHDDHDDDDDHEDDDHDDHEDDDDDGHDDHGHAAGGVDPHFFTDPARMMVAAEAIADFLVANLDSLDVEQLQADTAEYIDELRELDADVEATLAAVPEERRVLVTNHQVFSYFAERYDFEVIGTVVPSGNTNDGVSARRLTQLTALLKSEGVDVVFTDKSSSSELARTLADEVGDVEVVDLFTESLGEPGSAGETYVSMVRANAVAIASALGD